MEKHVKVITDSAIIINRIAGLLKEEGVDSIIKNNVESARLAGFGTPNDNVELWIEEADINKAQKVISDFK
ncbi:MAG: putative signal transducing protein [Flavobacteriaceae bacterium]